MQKIPSRRDCLGYLFSLFALALFPIQTQATTLKPMTLSEMTAQAERILLVTVIQVEAQRGLNALPTTAYHLKVEEILKGQAEAVETLHFYGEPANLRRGGFGGLPAMPTLTAGEKVLLFLTPPSSLGLTGPVGLNQGVLKVRVESGREMLTLSPLLSHGDIHLDEGERAQLSPGTLALDAFLPLLQSLIAKLGD